MVKPRGAYRIQHSFIMICILLSALMNVCMNAKAFWNCWSSEFVRVLCNITSMPSYEHIYDGLNTSFFYMHLYIHNALLSYTCMNVHACTCTHTNISRIETLYLRLQLYFLDCLQIVLICFLNVWLNYVFCHGKNIRRGFCR